MNEPTMDNMVQRLDRLERENCRLKLSGVIVLFLIGAVVLTCLPDTVNFRAKR